jgi:sugar lactone lactonase YvrE
MKYIYVVVYFMKRLLSCFFLLLPLCIRAQVITTIAGNGTAGYSGDGGAATVAQLVTAYGVAVDHSGNVYFSDNGYPSRVRKINAAGIITPFAGLTSPGFSGDGGAATLAAIANPHGICLDRVGNLYIADSNARIRKVDTFGIITTFAGIGGTGGFSGDGGPATAARLNHPWNLAADTSGNIYIADNINHRIRKVDPAGIITTVAGTGTTGFSGDGGPATDALIAASGGIATDRSGNLFIADNAARIRKVNASGIISTFAGTGVIGFSGDGGPATAATISNTSFVTTDKAGDVFIADYLNYRIRKIDLAGVITTVAGNGISGYTEDYCTATANQISLVSGIAVDDNGLIYFSDYYSHKVRRVNKTHNPAFTFVSGDGPALTMCSDSGTVSIDTFLAIIDSDNNQGEVWTVLTAPVHGTIVAGDSSVSNSGLLTPLGFTYAPFAGYTGSDYFSIVVSDCGGMSDTITINLAISACDDTSTYVRNVDRQKTFTISPNPANSVIHIQGTQRIERVDICDLLGQTVFTGADYGATSADVNVLRLASGLYVVKINSTDIRTFIRQ